MCLRLPIALKHLAAEGDAHETQDLLGDGGGASDQIADPPSQKGLYLAEHKAVPEGVASDDASASEADEAMCATQSMLQPPRPTHLSTSLPLKCRAMLSSVPFTADALAPSIT